MLLTGIGGQGIQLAAQVLAEAALDEGRDVQLFGAYGGMMRGGSTEATLVVSDGSIEAPPTAGSAWAALVMHPDYADPVLCRVRSGGVVLVNTSVWGGPTDRERFDVIEVAATDQAVEIGNLLTAAMVMLGALGRSHRSGVARRVGGGGDPMCALLSAPARRGQHAGPGCRRPGCPGRHVRGVAGSVSRRAQAG